MKGGEDVSLAKKLIDEFAEGYTEKLFYFCLKKTGNSFEAEDLASDIALNVITALKKGFCPDNFPAWVWQIARNRYSKWADKKRRYGTAVHTTDINDFEAAGDIHIENDVIHSEELSLLRRELAFISSDYRNIVVAFYIDDRKAADIAKSLNLPKGTVTTRLYRARNILKEGINMAREFGARSYKPEDIDFSSSGKQPTGLPWRAVSRSIPKNILIEASNNPSTMEELAIALGIAMPYMEEEVKLLLDATLLKKLDDGRYITDFYIASAECQKKIYDTLCRDSAKRSVLIDKIISSALPLIRECKGTDNMSDSDIKWWACMMTADLIANKVTVGDAESDMLYLPKKRANGEDWGFMGYENVTLPRPLFSGHNGTWAENGDQFWAFKISNFGMLNRIGEMKYQEVVFLADVVRNDRKTESFTSSEEMLWNGINNRFAHEEDGKVVPDILVITSKARTAMIDRLFSNPLTEELISLTNELFEEIKALIENDTTKYTRGESDYAAAMFILHTRMTTVYDLVESGAIKVPEDPNKSTVAMWLDLVD